MLPHETPARHASTRDPGAYTETVTVKEAARIYDAFGKHADC